MVRPLAASNRKKCSVFSRFSGQVVTNSGEAGWFGKTKTNLDFCRTGRRRATGMPFAFCFSDQPRRSPEPDYGNNNIF